MRILRVLFRGGLLSLHVALGLLLTTFLILPALRLWPARAPAMRDRIVLAWFRGLLCLLRVHVHSQGQAAPAPALIVANHIGWLDILALSGALPGSFVAKAEIRRWPAIGWLCKAVETLFVERGSHASTEHAIAEITRSLRQGRSVFVFPEGTSTDGHSVKPFRRRLYRAALECGGRVQAVALLYPKDGGPDPAAVYAGEDSLWQSFLRVLSAPEIALHIHYCPPLAAADFSGDNADTALARQTRAQVLEVFRRAYPPGH